jgi:hypothetical protein
VVFFTTLGVWLLGFGGFTLFVDPYDMLDTPDIDGFNARKTRAHEDGYRVRVGHRLLTTDAGTIIMGSSRVADGFPRDLPDFEGGWENLGMAGTSAYELANASTLAARNDNINCVMIGMDLREFTTGTNTQATYWITPLSGDHPAISLTKLALSPHAFARALQTVIDNANDGQDDKWVHAYDEDRLRARFEEEITKRYRFYANYEYDPERVDFLFRGVDAMLAAGKQVVMFIHPVHVWQEEAAQHVGANEEEVAFRRDVAAHIAARPELADANNACFAGPALQVWDFGGFNDVALTAPPAEDGLDPNPWYYVPAHYRPTLGAAILDRISGVEREAPVDANFGQRLTPENVETLLTGIQTRRQAWLNSDDEWMTYLTNAFAHLDENPPEPEASPRVYLSDIDRRDLEARIRPILREHGAE